MEDISDLAYTSRHRKYELAEKRIKNRENEILQYHLYKVKEMKEKLRYLEINNLIPSQHNENVNSNNTINNNSNNNNNNNNVSINHKHINNNSSNGKENKETIRKSKKSLKTEKIIRELPKRKCSKESVSQHTRKSVSKKEVNVNNSKETKPKTKAKTKTENKSNSNNNVKNNNIPKDNNDDLKIIEIINVEETEYDKLQKNKRRLNAAIEKLLSCRINPYPDKTHKLRRCTRKLKAFGVALPNSLNKQLSFDDIIINQKDINLNINKHRASKRIRKSKQHI